MLLKFHCSMSGVGTKHDIMSSLLLQRVHDLAELRRSIPDVVMCADSILTAHVNNLKYHGLVDPHWDS